MSRQKRSEREAKRRDRRRFVAQALATGAAASGWRTPLGQAQQQAGASAAQIVVGKDPRLIVHGSHPVELETPIDLLRQTPRTPTSLVFVRNNQMLAGSLTCQPWHGDEWHVDIDGLVEFPRRLSLDRLREMEQVEVELVLQCSGNGRAWFSKAAPAKGAPWRDGALANVRFGGVRLRTVLAELDPHLSPAARFLTASGKDTPVKPGDADFEHSIPLADALERSILALRMNGEALPAVHGGPVRLVTPGFYGTMNVKWVTRLVLADRETFNHHQVARYRTPLRPIRPGSKFTSTLENSEANWNMRIKSVFFAPLAGERVTAGNVELRGVAWNDGQVPIASVELSSDGGKRWQQAQLRVPDSPFAWYPWHASLELAPGRHELRCRAVDALGRTQPYDGSVDWNPSGYAWHGVESIEITAS